MKHLKTYKIFESDVINHLESLVDTTRDILTDISDDGYSVEVKVDTKYIVDPSPVSGDCLRIKIEGKREENLYSEWRQDRENDAKEIYNKYKNVLERVNEVLTSSGLEIATVNGLRVGKYSYGTKEGQRYDYGEIKQGYDKTGRWLYYISYVPKNSDS